jgi:hypothetical protein
MWLLGESAWLPARLDCVRPVCYSVGMLIDALIAVGIGATVLTATITVITTLDRRAARRRPPYDPRR